VFLTGEPTDALVGATPTSYATFAISGSASAFHITAGAADTALDIGLAMNAGAKLAVGTFDTIASAGAKPVLLITRGPTVCATKSSGRLLVDQVTFNAAGRLTRLVARWQFRCNGAIAASFGGVTWNGTAAFHTRTISPSAVKLGNQRMGWPGGTKAITVTNTGPARLTVTKVTLTGAQAADFDLVADNCSWVGLAVGQACTIAVRYHPTHRLGAQSATLTVFDDVAPAGGLGQRISLTGTAVTFQGLYTPVTPTRIADSRTGRGLPMRKLAAEKPVDLQVLGVAGVPTTGVSAVVIDLITLNATAITSVRAWASGTPSPTSSVANPAPFRTRVQQITVAVGGNGKVSFVNHAGTLDIAVDVVGYYAGLTGPKGLAYRPVAPVNLFDTRLGIGAFPPQPIGPKHSLGASLLGSFGGTSARLPKVVVLSVSVTGATANGSLHVFRYDPTKPPTATAAPGIPAVAFNTGIDTSNLVTFALGGATQVWFYANTTGNVHVHVDIVGTYVVPANDATGVPTSAGRFVPITTTRAFDSRSNGGAVVGGVARTLTLAPIGAPTPVVPADALAVTGTLTAFSATAPAELAVVSADVCPTPAVLLSTALAGFAVPVAVQPALSVVAGCSTTAGQVTLTATAMPGAAAPPRLHMVLDLVGYFSR
jgi:hypothetical protein